MNEYDKLLKLTDDSKVELASGFKDLLHTHLVLGQTRYMCRYGTLSEGHEKITPSQRYYAAIKESYIIAGHIRAQRASAMLAQADLLDAQEGLECSKKASDKLRYEAKCLQAKERLLGALTTVEDQMRMLDEYNRIRLELAPEVETKYPKGIEQAEEDNWKALVHYRNGLSVVSGPQSMQNIPLEPTVKAKLGFEINRPDMLSQLLVSDNAALQQLALEHKESR